MNPITISALTTHIVALFETDDLLRDVTVTAEVSTWKRAASGHVYFSLKDEGASINAVMWKGNAMSHTWLPQAGDQIVAQSCPQLSMYIEQGYDSMETELLIDAYVDEALSGMEETGAPLTVSFNCTHFGYSLESWKLAFESRGVEVAAYLDPNTQMVDFLVPETLWQRYPQSEVTVSAFSMLKISEASVESIGRFLNSVSPATEKALREIHVEPGLFEWQSLVVGAGAE